MRWLFALLLLANSALFLVMQLPGEKTGGETTAQHAPFHAENIRLIAEGALPPASPPPAPAILCMEWGMFSGQELERARNALKTLPLGENDVSVRKSAEKHASYWVYVPPLKSRQEANRKVEELKALGIPDSFVMQDNNKWRHAVSLGIFSTEEGAARYLAQMQEKGVKSAKAGPRNPENGHASLLLRGSGELLETGLVKLKQDFPGSELKAVSCAP